MSFFPTGKYYIATMTMVTASTALTIFIMNIHHCGPEARPVPQWAERFILNYLARICFVYEVGENCLSVASPEAHTVTEDEREASLANSTSAKGANWEVNGQMWGRKVEEDRVSLKAGQAVSSPADWKENLFVTVDDSEVGEAGEAQLVRGGKEQYKEKKGVGGRAKESQRESKCICKHPELSSNIEFITSTYQDQRAAQLRIGEWRKVAKVMDRFFMWLFFLLVFFMSILILGKAI